VGKSTLQDFSVDPPIPPGVAVICQAWK